MLVFKNNCEEEFDENKLRKCIELCAERSNYILTQWDSDFIIKEVKKIMKKLEMCNKMTSTYEIRGIVYYVLKENHFKKLSKEYMYFD